MNKSNYIIEFYKQYKRVPTLNDFQFADVMETAFKMPPEKALKWLKKRGENLKITIKWDELDAEAHDKAFTIAKVMSADLLQDIYNSVEKAKNEGLSLKQFKKDLVPTLEQKGWGGLAPSRLKVIYDTNMQMSYSKGQYEQNMLIAEQYPYWKYVQIERKTKRHDHSKFHNKIFRYDDPIWNSIYPPSGYGCSCMVIPLSEKEVSQQGLSVSSGEKFMKDIDKNSTNLTPLKAWKPETKDYASGIKMQLEKILKVKKPEKARTIQEVQAWANKNLKK